MRDAQYLPTGVLTAALVTALTGIRAYGVTLPVYTAVAPAAELPYIRVGEHEGSDWSTKTGWGTEVGTVVHIWDAEGSQARLDQVCSRIAARIVDQALDLGNDFAVASARLVEFRTLEEEDEETGRRDRHAVLRFSLRIEQTA